jgi:hypothetical protein
VYPVPKVLRLLALAISGAVVASAVIGAALALLGPVLWPNAHVAWVLAGFEVVTIVAAVFGVQVGLGRYSEAPGLALACAAGTVLVASTLAWQGSARNYMGVSLTPFLLARAVASMALGFVGAACVLRRDPRSWRWAIIGAAMAAPAGFVALAMVSDRGWRLLDTLMGTSPVQRLAVGTLGAVTVGALLAAGGHMVIRAFELGRRDEPGAGATSSRSA